MTTKSASAQEKPKRKPTRTQQARSYHEQAVAKIDRELALLSRTGSDSLVDQIRQRELVALKEQEQREYQMVLRAREVGAERESISHTRGELSKVQKNDRRKAILDLIKAQPIPGLGPLMALLEQQGFYAGNSTVMKDLRELNIVRYKPSPSESIRYALVAPDGDELNHETLMEYVLSNAAGFALQEIARKGDRLFLSCTHRTAGHLQDALAERSIPGVLSIMSDNYSTVWIEMQDDLSARQMETLLRKYMVWSG